MPHRAFDFEWCGTVSGHQTIHCHSAKKSPIEFVFASGPEIQLSSGYPHQCRPPTIDGENISISVAAIKVIVIVEK